MYGYTNIKLDGVGILEKKATGGTTAYRPQLGLITKKG